jgi:hypothetical protein
MPTKSSGLEITFRSSGVNLGASVPAVERKDSMYRPSSVAVKFGTHLGHPLMCLKT